VAEHNRNAATPVAVDKGESGFGMAAFSLPGRGPPEISAPFVAAFALQGNRFDGPVLMLRLMTHEPSLVIEKASNSQPRH